MLSDIYMSVKLLDSIKRGDFCPMKWVLCLLLLLFFDHIAGQTASKASLKKTPDSVTFAIVQDWAPYEFLDADGQYQGLTADYLRLIAEHSELKFKLRRDIVSWDNALDSLRAGTIDLLPSVFITPDRKQQILFTEPYISIPFVVVASNNHSLIHSLSELNHKKLACMKGWAIQDTLQHSFPDIELILCTQIEDLISSVLFNTVDAAILDLGSLSYLISHHHISGIRIISNTKYAFPMSIGITKNNPELYAAVSKAITSITSEEHEQLRDKWIDPLGKPERLWIQILVVVLIVVMLATLVSFAFYLQLKRLVAQRTAELKHIKDNLEQLVREQVIEYEQLNEELTATNEELGTANEELASTNEEIASINESLREEISKREEIQEQLELSEETFRNFLYQSGDGICIIDQQGHIVEWNAIMEDLTNFSRDEVYMRYMWEIESKVMPPEVADKRSEEALKKIMIEYLNNLQKGRIISLEGEYATVNKRHYVLTTLFPIITSKGSYVGRITKNITEKKQNEIELEQYRNLLELMVEAKTEQVLDLTRRMSDIFENTSDAVFFVDVREDEFYLTHYNKICEEALDFPHDQLGTGRRIDDLLKNSKDVEILKQHYRECVQSPTAIIREQVTTVNNVSRYWSTSLIPIRNEQGEVYRIAGVAREVTTQKRMQDEQMFTATLTDLIQNIIMVVDSQGNLIRINHQCEKILGLSRSEIIGKPLQHVMAPFDETDELSVYCKQLNNGAAPKHRTIKIVGHQGKEYKIMFGFSTLTRSNNNVYTIISGTDITARIKTEDALRESEERFRTAIESIPFEFWVCNQSERFLINNQKFIDHYGDMVGKYPADIEAVDIWLANKRVLQGEVVNEERCFYVNEQPRWVQNVMAPIKLNDQIVGFIGVNIDISDRKQAEDRLRESEQLFRTVVENLPFEFWVCDKEGRYSYLNSRFKENYGDLVGKFPKDAELPPETIKLWENNNSRALMGETFSEERHVDFINYDKWVLNILAPIKVNSHTNGFLGIDIDITDRKLADQKLIESEQRFRLVIDKMFNGIAIHEPIWDENHHMIDYVFIDCNPAYEYHTTLKRADIINKKAKEVLSVLESHWLDAFEKTMKDGVVIQQEGYAAALNRFFQINTFKITENQFAVIVEDTTEKRQMQQRLIETIIDTEERERRRFAGDLHDEIGPQLASMRMYTSTLLRKSEHTELAEILVILMDLIKMTIQNVREISNNLSPQLLESYGLASAVNAEVENTRLILPVTFDHNIGNLRFENKIETVYFRIVKELLNNTKKYANATHTRIDLFYTSQKLVLDYSDDGIGFDLEHLQKDESHGMGLTNIDNRVKSIQGTFYINTSPNNGFHFHLETLILHVTSADNLGS